MYFQPVSVRRAAAVLEVGLGGRLDSTNVCPRVSIITSISFDHTRQLGNTLAAIAPGEGGHRQAGSAGAERRDGRRAPPGDPPGLPPAGCRLVESGIDFDFPYRPPQHLERKAANGRMDFYVGSTRPPAAAAGHCPGAGRAAQAANAALALAAWGNCAAGWNIPEEAIRCRPGRAGLAGRVEVVARRPAVVLDAAHNGASIEALLETLGESFSPFTPLLVFATTQEKDIRGMIAPCWTFRRGGVHAIPGNPRAAPPAELQGMRGS